jgi:Arylsulfotransferase (ASST)
MRHHPHPRGRLRRAAATVASLTAVAVPAALVAAPASAATSPPPVSILTAPAHPGRGDIFVTPTGDAAQYANGPEILDQKGNVVWSHAIPQGQTAADFRVQRYHGQPVLTWWQGTGLGGLAQGTDYIYNSRYEPVATVQAGHGLSADGHEFLITPQNTALILAYTTATADLTSIGGPANQTVIDGVVQEIDIRTGRVLFQWNSADHVPYSQSEQPLPASAGTPWDWFHINAVHLDSDGNLLVDARNTWTTYKVGRRSGTIIWRLGGKASDFALSAAPGQSLNTAGDIFAWQHDPNAVGHGEYTFFDNESAGLANTGTGAVSEFGFSRAVRVRLDERRRTATLVQSYDQPEWLTAPSQGNAQTTADGRLLVGWGSLPYFSEFSRSGRLLLNAQFPAGVNSYRAYAFPWPASELESGRTDRHRRGH